MTVAATLDRNCGREEHDLFPSFRAFKTERRRPCQTFPISIGNQYAFILPSIVLVSLPLTNTTQTGQPACLCSLLTTQNKIVRPIRPLFDDARSQRAVA